MRFSIEKKQQDYIAQHIANGEYPDASAVVRDALRLHEKRYLKLEALCHEIDEADQEIAAGKGKEYSTSTDLLNDVTTKS